MTPEKVLYERHTWLTSVAELNAWAVAVRAVAESDGGFYGMPPFHDERHDWPGLRVYPWTPPPGALRVQVEGVEAWHLLSGEVARWNGKVWVVVAALGPLPRPELPVYGGMEAAHGAGGADNERGPVEADDEGTTDAPVLRGASAGGSGSPPAPAGRGAGRGGRAGAGAVAPSEPAVKPGRRRVSRAALRDP